MMDEIKTGFSNGDQIPAFGNEKDCRQLLAEKDEQIKGLFENNQSQQQTSQALIKKLLALQSKLEEKDVIIYGLQEGAENWEAEYNQCRKILENLCELKTWKDANINMDIYEELKPKAWQAAKVFLLKYTHL